MNASRHLTAGIIALAISSLSCPLTLLTSDSLRTADHASSPATPDTEIGADAIAAERVLSGLHTGLLPAELSRLSLTIAAESRRAGLPMELVLGVILVESAGNNFAVSSVGAMGLMQLMPRTGEAVAAQVGMLWEGPMTLFDPVANVRLGIVYLEGLVERYETLTTALAAYNWGPTRIAKRLERGDPIPAIYARRVLLATGGAKSAALQI
jgi:soluble lytic murein transglycosylase-like protein